VEHLTPACSARTKSALALLAAFLLAACTRIGSSTAPQATRDVVPGVVRIALVGPFDNLIPELAGNAASSDAAMFWGGWLLMVDGRGALEPDLALDVPSIDNGGISKDGLTITYHLRRRVTWQDGAPFDARDVIFSWHAIMNPANNIISRAGYDDIASMTAPDPYTVKVQLKSPYAPAVATFFAPGQAPYCILPAHMLANLPDINRAAYDRLPVGTGPFIVTRYQPGIELDLAANPRYWRGPPKLKAIRFITIPDSNTALVMMKTGDVDIWPEPPEALVPELAKVAGVRVIHRPWNQFEYIGFNLTHAPLDDRNVRLALAMDVNRDLLVANILHGNGSVANGDQPAYSWAFDPAARAPAYDPAGAAALLERSGWRVGRDGIRMKDGKRLALEFVWSESDVNASRFAPILQDAMRKIGVELDLKPFEHDLYYATKETGGIVNSGKFDVSAQGWVGGVDPDNSSLWACAQRPPNGFNTTLLCDQRVDAAISVSLSTNDQAKRRAAYWRIQELLDRIVNVDFLYWVNRNDAVRNGLAGWDPAPSVTPFWNNWNWAWQ